VNPFKAIGKGLKATGKVVAYPVTKPVSMLAKKAGASAAEGAMDKIKSEVVETFERPKVGQPYIGPPAPTWKDFAKYLVEFVWLKFKNRKP
jgi:hypothetical protein